MDRTHNVRLIGRYFQGVVSSLGSSPDGSQDVTKVFPERARIAVADGAGDTGGAAGEWASMLALCYGSAEATGPLSEPKWLARAVEVWGHALNLSGLASGVASISVEDLALLQRGVDASFIGATFGDRGGILTVNWVASGDCEAFLFRGYHLLEYGPVSHWNDFGSTPESLNSKAPQTQHLVYGEWHLAEADVLIFCSDALGSLILQACGEDKRVSGEVVSLMQCMNWHDLQQYVDAWREDGRLRNDDVAMVRVRIHRRMNAGRFFLARDTDSALMQGNDPVVEPTLDPLPVPPSRDVVDPSTLLRNPEGSTDAFLEGEPPPLEPTGRGIMPEVAEQVAPTEERDFARRQVLEERRLGRHDAVRALDPDQIGREAGAVEERAAVVGLEQPRDHRQGRGPLVPLGSASSTRRARILVRLGYLGSFLLGFLIAESFEFGSKRQAASPADEKPPRMAPVATSPGVVAGVEAELQTPVDGGGEAPSAPVSTQPSPPLPQDGQPVEAAMGQDTLQTCILSKGTMLYGTPDSERIPLLKVEGPQVGCAFDETAQQDLRRIVITVWLKAGGPGSSDSAFLNKGRLRKPTNVWTSPPGEVGHEYVGNVRSGTSVVLGKRTVWKGQGWAEVTFECYRSAQ